MATEFQRTIFKGLLKTSREDAGLTQRDLAARMQVDPSTVAQWEIGRSAPREELAAKLEHVFDADPGTFRTVLGFEVREDVTMPGVTTVRDAIAADRWLTGEQRHYLTLLYRDMVRRTRSQERAAIDAAIDADQEREAFQVSYDPDDDAYTPGADEPPPAPVDDPPVTSADTVDPATSVDYDQVPSAGPAGSDSPKTQ